jgi:hypothetical protein
METKKMVLTIAAHIFKDYEKAWAKYDQDCEQSWRAGYRPSHCFHGTNLWTSYDPMCGPCEDGLGWFNREEYRKLALGQAHRDVEEWHKRVILWTTISANNVPGIDYGQLIEWVGEPVNKHKIEGCKSRLSTNYPPF